MNFACAVSWKNPNNDRTDIDKPERRVNNVPFLGELAKRGSSVIKVIYF